MASRVAEEGGSKTDVNEGKFYDVEDKKRFREYFIQPPAKRGRPKKNGNRGRPPKKSKQPSQSMMVHDLTTDGDDGSVDLVAKDKADLDARLEGMLARAKREQSKQKRTNWDTPANAALRESLVPLLSVSPSNKNSTIPRG